MKRYVSESVGTFALVLVGVGVLVRDSMTGGAVLHTGVGLTIGLLVMVTIYMVGDISGAHFNPAVTVGFWWAGLLSDWELIPYVISQLFGAVLASILLLITFPADVILEATLPSVSVTRAFVFEVVLTFLLIFGIMSTVSEEGRTRPVIGLVIGGIMTLCALFTGSITLTSMNPAQILTPVMAGFELVGLWFYITGTFFGAVLAAVVWQLLQGGESN